MAKTKEIKREHYGQLYVNEFEHFEQMQSLLKNNRKNDSGRKK